MIESKVILVTGGAGYIGSHTVLELLNNDFEVIVLDNLVNSSAESLKRIENITKRVVGFIEGDIRDGKLMDRIFSENKISQVVHFAGLKSVGESVKQPLEYFDNNVSGTIALCLAMEKAGCRNLIFSSSATVYGNPVSLPITEEFKTSATNPYGKSKLIIEEILKDLAITDKSWNIALLRYFNPVGAHSSGLIGQASNDIPNNLVSNISQVAVGKLPHLHVFGKDYPTIDGTGVRDYIHVVDLAIGHIKVIMSIEAGLFKGVKQYNLGTGKGYSVLDVIKAFEKASGKKIEYKFTSRRQGDISECWADSSLAYHDLGWKAERNLSDMLTDTWNWQKNNPNGYE